MKKVKRRLGKVVAILMSLLVITELFYLPVSAMDISDKGSVSQNVDSVQQGEEDSTFVLANSNVQVSDDYLPEEAYISEIESPEYELKMKERDYSDGLVLSKTVGDPMVYLTQK